MPCRRLERERILPSLVVHVAGHIDVPGPPGPHPAGVGHLRVCDVHGAVAQISGLPGGGVEIEEGAVRVEGDAEEEPPALVLVEDVELGVGFEAGEFCGTVGVCSGGVGEGAFGGEICGAYVVRRG